LLTIENNKIRIFAAVQTNDFNGFTGISCTMERLTITIQKQTLTISIANYNYKVKYNYRGKGISWSSLCRAQYLSIIYLFYLFNNTVKLHKWKIVHMPADI